MSMWSAMGGEWALTSAEADTRQCCPMDTYDTDSAGNLRNTCECDDECTCMCGDCLCEAWGDEEDPFWWPG